MTMKIGIDSYCFHRFFGEVYPEQPQPPKSMTLEDFIELAKKLNVNGVSLESCFIPQREDAGYMANIKALLDESGQTMDVRIPTTYEFSLCLHTQSTLFMRFCQVHFDFLQLPQRSNVLGEPTAARSHKDRPLRRRKRN